MEPLVTTTSPCEIEDTYTAEEEELLKNYEKFKQEFKEIHLKCGIKIKKEDTNFFLKNSELKEIKLKFKNVDPIKNINDTDGSYNVIITKFNIDEKELVDKIIKENIPHAKPIDYTITEEEIILSFANFSYDESLKKFLPEDFHEVPGSYEIIGRIAHLNLKEKFLRYKKLIGRVILDVSLDK